MRKHVQERQARKLAEGQQDMANRCSFCKRGLRFDFVMVIGADGKPRQFCNADCQADDAERTALMEARR